MLLDITQEDRQLWVSYFNLDGKTRFKTYDLQPEDMFNWEVCDGGDSKADPKIKNWDGRSVKKARSRYLNKYRIIEYMDQLSFSDRELIFGYHFPKTFFVDIEVEVTDSFPEPSKAPNPVTAICIVTPEKQCIVLATKDLDKSVQIKIQKQIDDHFKAIDEEFFFTFKCFKNEYDMLYTFMDSFVKKFSMMTGWNYVQFDWQYIVNRCKKLGIDPSIASPIGRTFGKHEFPCHVGVMDYLDIYAKWDRTVEIKTMEIALTIAHMTQISIFKAASPVAITEALLAREFLTRDLVMAKDPKAPPTKRQQFEGAFVKEPKTGMHNAVAAFDFASLYPSIMRQLNVSPESFIKKVKPEFREREVGEDRIVSVTGAVYDTKTSILKDVLSRLYGERKTYKKESFRLQQKAYDLEQELKKQDND